MRLLPGRRWTLLLGPGRSGDGLGPRFWRGSRRRTGRGRRLRYAGFRCHKLLRSPSRTPETLLYRMVEPFVPGQNGSKVPEHAHPPPGSPPLPGGGAAPREVARSLWRGGVFFGSGVWCVVVLSGCRRSVVLVRLTVRLPDELHERLVVAALAGRRSVNSELIVRLEDGLKGREQRLEGGDLGRSVHAPASRPLSPVEDGGLAGRELPAGAADAMQSGRGARLEPLSRPASSSEVTPDWRGGKP